jgi:hypothetical protein
VAGGWRRLHNEELHSLYVSLNIIMEKESRRMKWAWYVARMGNMKCICNFCWKRPIGRSRRKWEDNIRMHRVEIGSKLWLSTGTSGGLL